MRKFSFLTFLILISSIMLFSCSKSGDLTIGRAVKSYQSKDYETALKLFKEALDEDSNYSPELINNFIANIYLQQEDLENAVIYQEKSCELHPDYRNLVSLGMTRHLLSQDDLAEEAYKRAVNLDPKKGEAYASLGALYLSQKKYAESLENLRKASEFEPKIAVIHANLAIAYAANGEFEKSENEFKVAEELNCENLDEFKERASEFR